MFEISSAKITSIPRLIPLGPPTYAYVILYYRHFVDVAENRTETMALTASRFANGYILRTWHLAFRDRPENASPFSPPYKKLSLSLADVN